MKYKVGDKVRIKSKEWYDENKDEYGDIDIHRGFIESMSKYCGKEVVIAEKNKRFYRINIDNGEFSWTDEMIECLVNEEKPMINEEVVKDIAEVIKKHNLCVSVSEKDGKIIVEQLEEDQNIKPFESGIYNNEDGGVSVVFGGKIHVAVGTFKPNSYCIGLQEFNGMYECGEFVEEEWMENRPTVNLVINNQNSIRILRDALDIVEKKLNKHKSNGSN